MPCTGAGIPLRFIPASDGHVGRRAVFNWGRVHISLRGIGELSILYPELGNEQRRSRCPKPLDGL